MLPYPLKSSLRLAEKALKEDWPLTASERREVIQEALAVLRSDQSPRCKMTAARVLVAADLVNVRREGLSSRERSADLDSALTSLQSMLSSPESRRLLAQLAQANLAGPPGAQDGSTVVGGSTPASSEQETKTGASVSSSPGSTPSGSAKKPENGPK